MSETSESPPSTAPEPGRPDLARIEIALNAYGWIQGETRARFGRRDRYDTIGALLRFAGIPAHEVATAGFVSWHRFGNTLVREYGLRDEVDCYLILLAGDVARSQEEAITGVLRALAGDLSVLGGYREFVERLVVDRHRRKRPPGGR